MRNYAINDPLVKHPDKPATSLKKRLAKEKKTMRESKKRHKARAKGKK